MPRTAAPPSPAALQTRNPNPEVSILDRIAFGRVVSTRNLPINNLGKGTVSFRSRVQTSSPNTYQLCPKPHLPSFRKLKSSILPYFSTFWSGLPLHEVLDFDRQSSHLNPELLFNIRLPTCHWEMQECRVYGVLTVASHVGYSPERCPHTILSLSGETGRDCLDFIALTRSPT